MILSWKRGRYAEGDRIIFVTTIPEEPISIFKLSLLINQMAINELIIRKHKGFSKFLFKSAIIDAIGMAEQGIDFGERKNKEKVRDYCRRHHLKFERIERDLEKVIQTKIGVI